ncbi:MAG: hypothetical protein NVSMB46_04120 [Candidatus Saccharimonadales bacterium]
MYNKSVNNDAIIIKNVCRLLELYGISEKISTKDVVKLEIYKSKIYGMQDVYSFDFKDSHYYITNDYSLNDSPKYIKDILIEVNPNLKGSVVENPIVQSDGAKYATGLDGTEYYLWKSPLL